MSSPQDAPRAVPETPVPTTASEPTDRPIPLWPEGVVALAAGAALICIGLRHRVWIQKKLADAQRAVETFQEGGAIEDIRVLAKRATDFLQRDA